jgi:hypothetical protein
MLKRMIKRYPISTGFGLFTTALFLYTTEDREFYRNTFNNRFTIRTLKEGNVDIKSFCNNMLLQVMPSNRYEWQIYMIILYFCAGRAERALGIKYLAFAIFTNALVMIVDDREYSKEGSYNPYILNLPICFVFWFTKFYPKIRKMTKLYCFALIAYMFYSQRGHSTEFGIASALFLNIPIRHMRKRILIYYALLEFNISIPTISSMTPSKEDIIMSSWLSLSAVFSLCNFSFNTSISK